MGSPRREDGGKPTRRITDTDRDSVDEPDMGSGIVIVPDRPWV